MERQITATDLAQFTGTSTYFKHWTRKIVYTDGVQYLAEQAGAYWLVDLIASYQLLCDERQYWTLKIEDGNTAPNAGIGMTRFWSGR